MTTRRQFTDGLGVVIAFPELALWFVHQASDASFSKG